MVYTYYKEYCEDGVIRMEKIEVTSGVYYVEIPEANLYVLCGCPADSVKHLMKRGLIVSKEKNGVTFETGPNAILLSDVPVQKGSFSNLAEFPVLQMFYRQGILLPNHPNNTGIKPMLIGTEDQVNAQSQYIYRGNYGLKSMEEIHKTGVPDDCAQDMFRLKLKFAFDNIRETEELIDFRIVREDPVELRGGVTIRRTAFNVYEFSYKDETVPVDLNLAPNQKYEPSYNLGFHEIRREYFSVIHIGEGDGWDTNRPCMGSILTYQGKIYLLDAGPNILYSLTALGISVNEIEGIFHSHVHDDHFAGLTTLVRSDHKIKYYAPKLVRVSVMKKLSALMSIKEERFERYFKIFDLKFNRWNSIKGLEVMPVFSPHPVETSIFFFRTLWGGGYKTYAHLADIVSLDVLKGMITDDPKKSGVSQEFYDNVKKIYFTPVDIKKIDIGGGLIHGKAEDFVNDTSPKIVLSHTSVPLTDSQKEIGANATFGMEDVLIPAQQDYSMRSAFYHLRSYFPKASMHDLHMLMNCPVVSHNIGSIIIKRGIVNKDIFLLLSGVVEFIDAETDIRNMLSAGSIVGELSALSGEKTTRTYRAASYIRALKIPSDLYISFIKRNYLYDTIRRVLENRRFLQNTWLFGEMVSCPIQNEIAGIMTRKSYAADEPVKPEDPPALFIVEQGKINLSSGGSLVAELHSGDFFGEETILFDEPEMLTAVPFSDAKIFLIPKEDIDEIPTVQWKLLETSKRRKIAPRARNA